ncbi:hypothetical protein [Naasia sp. SYSU D00057]|uniref:hypothetical protein n=1 Tax=Naasia sp. SYSU D00057 TaxID=2817380 RepID=UPI001B3137CD|nr:hypothetical protein [Naasia sp. SYSU D00057]
MSSLSTPRRYRGPARPGHLSVWKHVGVYVILAVLVVADYLLLQQSLLMLNRSASAAGSIGFQLYLVTAGFSVMMIVLPHVAAIAARRVSDGIYRGSWKWLLAVIALVWVAILVLVTTMRISASATSDAPTATEAALGAAAPAPAGGVDLLAPESLMALMTAFFLTATGIASFFVTYFTSRPLLAAVEQAERVVYRARQERDDAAVAVRAAEADVAEAEALDDVDAQRLEIAHGIVVERFALLRSEIATRLAEHEQDPRQTSHLLRELNSRRDRLAVLPRPDMEDAG